MQAKNGRQQQQSRRGGRISSGQEAFLLPRALVGPVLHAKNHNEIQLLLSARETQNSP